MKKKRFILYTMTLYVTLVCSPLLAQSDSTENISTLDTLRGSLLPLNWAEKEVVGISEIMNGEVFCHGKATESVFKAKAPQAGILHIATHAVVNDVNPMFSKLVFAPDSASSEDGYVNTYELYNIKLNAGMVVLSACNTGYGKLIRGEGIISLARGFMYAGCPSLVMSLWSVDDQSTSRLMNIFYGKLVQGQNKDEALRQAKLDFLKDADEIKSNPFYWSGMIFVGNTDPIPFNERVK